MKAKLISVFIIFAAAAAGYWFWLTSGKVVAESAVVDGRLAIAVSSVSGTVNNVHARAGAVVAKGQPLFTLDSSGYEITLAEERARLAEIAASLPGNLRVPSSLGAGALPSERPLGELRAEEDEARKAVEAASQAYASASLALSRIEGGNKSKAERQKTLIGRDEAAILLQQAKERHEAASYARARSEAAAKAAASEGVVSAAIAARVAKYQAQISRVRLAEQALAATVVHAPESGRLLSLTASPGGVVAAGEAAAAILPEDGSLFVTAFFSKKDAEKLEVGQECGIAPLGADVKFADGRIEEILPASGKDKKIAARIGIDDDEVLFPLKPGEKVSVMVWAPIISFK